MVNSVIQKVFVADVSHRQPFHTIFSLAQMQTDRQGARQSPSGDGGQWRSSFLKGLLSETVTKCIKIIEMLRNRYLYVTTSNYMSLNCYKFAMKPIQQEVSNLKPSFSGSMLNFLSVCGCVCVCVFSVPFASRMTTFKRRLPLKSGELGAWYARIWLDLIDNLYKNPPWSCWYCQDSAWKSNGSDAKKKDLWAEHLSEGQCESSSVCVGKKLSTSTVSD